ncbi:MAG TPA: PAS domain S-box protein [Dehalococcoidia bacterium]|nr:PAS domain S-box protein [Dehalococcoidia bacterium]
MRIGIGTVRRLAASGQIPAVKIGRRWHFYADALDTWLISPSRAKPKEDLRQWLSILDINDGYIVIQDEKVVFANARSAEMVGYELEEIIGKPAESFLSEAVREEVLERYRRRLRGMAEPPQYETTLLRRDGTRLPVELSIAPPMPYEGRPAVFLFIRDITERKRAEEEILRNYRIQTVLSALLRISLRDISLEEQLELILKHIIAIPWLTLKSRGCIFLVEDDPKVLVMKAQHQQPAPLLAMCTRVPFGRCLCGRAASSGGIQFADRVDERHENRYEGISPHGHYCVPILADGKVLGVINLYLEEGHRRDEREEAFLRAVADVLAGIIERKQAERKIFEYEELSRLKTNLLSTVSHELRTPLAAIKGYSTMLLDYDRRLKHDEKLEYLRSIDKAADRLTELVDHLLDMSRLQAGLLKLEKAPTNIVPLLKGAVLEAQLRAPRHRIVLKAAKRLPRVNVDARRIRQVVDNILDNATKYSEGGTEVVLRACRRGSELVISVSDQGIGIPPEDLERVFDRMYRIEQRLTPEIGGIGLGLAICKGLVEAHGGRIWMESEEGKGSTCWFTLPL